MDFIRELIESANFNRFLVTSLILVLTCFEIAPIKFNPISSIFKWIGEKINGQIVKEMSGLREEINKIQYDNEKRAAVACRVRILRFSDELRQGIRHSKESFDQALIDIDGYQKYCNTHPEFLNNKTHLATERIMEAYNKCMQDNDFL